MTGVQLTRLWPAPAGPVDAEDAYGRPGPRPGRPAHLRVNFVTSLDGATSIDHHSGPLSSPGDRLVLGALRALADVIMVGAGTVRLEGYGPTRPSEARRARRRAQGLAEVPPFAVVSGRLDLDFEAPLFTSAQSRPILLTAASAPAGQRAHAARYVDVVVAGADRVEPNLALNALAERGLTHVLCEGGPELLGQLVSQGWVDELCLSISPMLAGPATSRLLPWHPGPGPWPRYLDLTQVLSDGATLFLRYGDATASGSGEDR